MPHDTIIDATHSLFHYESSPAAALADDTADAKSNPFQIAVLDGTHYLLSDPYRLKPLKDHKLDYSAIVKSVSSIEELYDHRNSLIRTAERPIVPIEVIKNIHMYMKATNTTSISSAQGQRLFNIKDDKLAKVLFAKESFVNKYHTCGDVRELFDRALDCATNTDENGKHWASWNVLTSRLGKKNNLYHLHLDKDAAFGIFERIEEASKKNRISSDHVQQMVKAAMAGPPEEEEEEEGEEEISAAAERAAKKKADAAEVAEAAAAAAKAKEESDKKASAEKRAASKERRAAEKEKAEAAEAAAAAEKAAAEKLAAATAGAAEDDVEEEEEDTAEDADGDSGDGNGAEDGGIPVDSADEEEPISDVAAADAAAAGKATNADAEAAKWKATSAKLELDLAAAKVEIKDWKYNSRFFEKLWNKDAGMFYCCGSTFPKGYECAACGSSGLRGQFADDEDFEEVEMRDDGYLGL